ncbi:MAG: hypothetical protein Q9160_007723 [Pyrenula sp. 1 TL-2023]
MGSSASKESAPRGRLSKGKRPSNATHAAVVDKQTGERRDYTALLHSIGHDAHFDGPAKEPLSPINPYSAIPGHQLLAVLPRRLWIQILEYMTIADIASFTLSCKAVLRVLRYSPLRALHAPENRRQLIDFLSCLDERFPFHLLCFTCATYHLRTHPGKENLKPPNTLNPLVTCPLVKDPTQRPPRHRLTPGRALPFTFVQLTTRAHRFTPSHGIPESTLSRRWKDRDSGWSHSTRYLVTHTGNPSSPPSPHQSPPPPHFLMRVVSQRFAPPGLPPSGMRHLLYSSMDDFMPHFSVCAHWRDGLLTNLCKCALSHIPTPARGLEQQLKSHLTHRPHLLVTLCGDCQPMRRCPKCPTEYLIEIKLVEDPDADPKDRAGTFKQAIVVTRWSDLGDGRVPWEGEWAACNGLLQQEEGMKYDSFKEIGARAISGVFESHFTAEAIPPQRILSLNPKGVEKGEEGHGWY